MVTECIDIMLILDTDLLRRRYPNPSQEAAHPTTIGADEAFIVATPRRIAQRGQGSDQLELHADGGEIHWRAIALSGNISHAIIYRIETDDSNLSADAGLVAAPEMMMSRSKRPIPVQDEPTRYVESSPQGRPGWRCEIRRAGLLHCGLCFYLVQQHDIEGHLDTAGYYRWDCTLTIEKPAQTG